MALSIPSVRDRLAAALCGEPVDKPVYAVYDWFVENRPHVNWQPLFEQGLGRINHANIIRHEHPGFELHAKESNEHGRTRRDVHLVTEHGELLASYVDSWQVEYFIKTPADYRIMARALEDVSVFVDDTAFLESEAQLGDNGITMGHLKGLGEGRTPHMVLQIDWVGLERWSVDLMTQEPAMLELIEIMNAIKLEEVRCAAHSLATEIKLWENLSITTMGPDLYCSQLVPLYKKITQTLRGSNKRIHVHYDGALKVIADQVARLDLDGIDSLTEAPEGDMTVAEARRWWPSKFLWIHPNLGWYALPKKQLSDQIKRIVNDAGPTRFCLEISEEVPHQWEQTIPAVLRTLDLL